MLRRILAGSACLLLALPALSLAEVLTLEVDPNHSEVGFLVKHNVVSRVPGRFDKFTGTVTIDPNDPSTMKLQGNIDATSIDTGNPKRDEHLKSADFFDVANNPAITFMSKKVTKNGDNWDVVGDIMIRGVTKEITLQVEPPAFMQARGGTLAGIEAKGKINRKDFGVNWNRTLDQGGVVVSDDVDLVLHVEAHTPRPEQAAQPAAPKPETAKK
jgi:polyisoprenoid-binding protein YceI